MIPIRTHLRIYCQGYGREFMFKSAIQRVIDRGQHPSGSRIRAELGRRVGAGMINGDETRWRREYLESLGWTRGSNMQSRWRPPEQ